MRKTKLLFSILLLFAIQSFGQQHTIKGEVKDTSNNFRMQHAVAALLRAEDSVLTSFTRCDAQGKFSLSGFHGKSYILMVTYPDYADYTDIITLDKDMDYGNIVMLSKAAVLENVIVRASPVRMRGDTIAFLADSFKVREGANVEDLLKKLPGFSVNSKGEITAQGKRVQKVLVDGDEFFGDDPTLATRNLQAAAIKEVEVFEKKSQQAEFTGVDDGQGTQTVNLKLKDNFKKGYFGKVELAGGLPKRYENQVMLNNFKDKRRLSIYGIGANTNRTALGWSEESQFGGGMGSNMQVGDDGSIMMWSSGDEFGGTGGFYGEGLPQSWTLGGSYSNKWNENRSNIVGSYRYQDLSTEANTTMNTQNILPDTQFFNNQRGKSEVDRWRNKALVRSEIFIDSMQSVNIEANASYGGSQTRSTQYSEALTGNKSPVNNSDRFVNSNTTQKSFEGNVLYKRKFTKARRTLSLNLSSNINEQETDGYLLNYNEFFSKGQLIGRDTTDQRKLQNRSGTTLGMRVAYTEPIGKKGILEMSYGLSNALANQERLSYDKADGKYEALNDSFSNNYRFKNLTNRAGLGYRYAGTVFGVGFGGDVAFNSWSQLDKFKDTTRNYDFTNFFPRANLSYKIGKYSTVKLNYNGRTNAPTIDQLQPVADNNNPLNIMIGNPDLVQSFTHNIDLGYNLWKMMSNMGLWVNLYYNNVSNDFSTRTFVDTVGRMVNQTVNVDGNYSFGGYAGFNMKLKKTGIDINSHFNPSISRRKSFVNNQENTTFTNSLNFGVNLNKDFDQKFNISLEEFAGYNTNKSSIRPDVVTRYWTSETKLGLYAKMPKGFEFGTDISYSWRQKTEVFGDNNNALLWNANLMKKMSKKKEIKAGIMVNDILNQNIGFQRDISSNFISERTYDVIRRYWMLKFTWTFNKGPEKVSQGW